MEQKNSKTTEKIFSKQDTKIISLETDTKSITNTNITNNTNNCFEEIIKKQEINIQMKSKICSEINIKSDTSKLINHCNVNKISSIIKLKKELMPQSKFFSSLALNKPENHESKGI